MGLLMQFPLTAREAQPLAGLKMSLQKTQPILIVCESVSDTTRLKAIFRNSGMPSESVSDVTAGCEMAKSGRYGVVFSTPSAGGKSWRRLIEVASQNNLNFEIVVLARSFDLNQWGEAMQLGAFDVLDVIRDMPKAAEVARRALGSSHLKRFRSRIVSGH